MLAKALANLARSHSTDSNFDSPYSMEARAKVKSYRIKSLYLTVSLWSEDNMLYLDASFRCRVSMFQCGRKFLGRN